MQPLAIEDVHHPLCGVRSPRSDDLLARCDDDARATFLLASRFAHQRIEEERAFFARRHAEPWGEPVGWRQGFRILASDLMHALLAHDGARVLENLLREDDRPGAATAAAEHWRDRAASVPLGSSPLELDDVFARRWAMDRAPDAAIDRDTLIDSLPLRCVSRTAALGARHADGLVTLEESLHSSIAQMADRRSRFPLGTPRAYWDRQHLLAALDRAVAHGPGAIVVGPPNSGRHALVEAWGRRLRTAGPANLRRHGFNIDNEHGGGIVEWRGAPVLTLASIDTRCIYVASRFGRELDPALPYRDDAKRFPHYVVDFALQPVNDFRLIVVTTPDQLALLDEQLPALRTFPRLAVPAIDDREVLPIWACQLPALENDHGIAISLARVIDRIAWRAPSRWREFTAHRDLVIDAPLAPSPAEDGETVESYLTSYVAAARKRGTARSKYLDRFLERSPVLGALLGDAERFHALLAIDSALRGI